MRALHWIVTALAVLALLWVVYAAAAPFAFDGHLYHVKQPVPVLRVTEEEVVIRIQRTSLLDMPATCSRKLVCEQVHHLPDSSCPIERGTTSFVVAFPIPNGAQGECTMRGLVSYSVAGAPLVHAWKSETFTVPERGGETE